MSWSHPPRPVDVIPSFVPGAESGAHLVLFDFMHDDGLRDYTGDGDVQKALGVSKQQDIDPLELIRRFDAGNAPNLSKLKDKVNQAINRRAKLGPLPKSDYRSEPVHIYYYDSDRMKEIRYPRASITAAGGFALDPGNIYWWKNHDIHTLERHSDGGWGDEGFDWDKDVAGNVGAITSTIMSIVGAVLEVIPGIGTAVGTAILVAAPLVGAALNVVDTAFQGGDMIKALSGLGTALVQAAANVTGAGAALGPVIKAAGSVVTTLAETLTVSQGQGGDMTGAWNALVAKASSMTTVNDTTIKAIGQALGSPDAAKLLTAGYDSSNYADMPTLQAVSALFGNKGAGQVYLFGASLGVVANAQVSNTATKQKAMVSHSIARGLHAPTNSVTARSNLVSYVQKRNR